jgi:hypothetical protein
LIFPAVREQQRPFMRMRNALALSVAVATIAPVALTGTSAAASGSSTAPIASSAAGARAASAAQARSGAGERGPGQREVRETVNRMRAVQRAGWVPAAQSPGGVGTVRADQRIWGRPATRPDARSAIAQGIRATAIQPGAATVLVTAAGRSEPEPGGRMPGAAAPPAATEPGGARPGIASGARALAALLPPGGAAGPVEYRPEGQADGSVAEPGEARPGDRFADRQPTCGKASAPTLPIATRIHGGPEIQHPGAGPRTWSVDLRNTTREQCHHIYPVIILTAGGPGLTADRVALEFYDESEARWRPVVLEPTSQEELVGAFDGGFRGFVVPAGRTVTVKVRLALAAATPPNAVTVNAAIVQRQGEDGDWVGESGDYRFAIARAATPTPAPTDSPAAVEPPGGITDELATTGTSRRVVIAAAVGAVVLTTAGVLLLLARRRFGSRGR